MAAKPKPPLKCYACNRAMWADRAHSVRTSDNQPQSVGPECFKHIERASPNGWQPPLGGPRLYRHGDL